MPNERKREWKSGDEYVDNKIAGVTAVLTRAGYDKEYRARLLSGDPETVKKAFAEEGSFDLPPDFRIECFERAGGDAASTDNTVMLVLPKEYELPAGADPMQADSREYWQCTYHPYRVKD
jgi:hypothetical protein